jgi:hypothetical protein
MAMLSGEIKACIVERLASHESAKQVQDAVLTQFGVFVSYSQLTAYNPERAAGSRMSREHKELFFFVRERFLKAAGDVPIANKTYRLWALNRAFNRAVDAGNDSFAADLVEQAAKECGGWYTRGGEVFEGPARVIVKDFTGRAAE